MPSHNSVTLIGNLTRDPEPKDVGEGRVCKFSLAVNKKFKRRDRDELVEEVSFFDVECWGRLAEVCLEHLGKGDPVFVAGALKQNRWEKDGNARSRVVIVARTVQFLSARGQAGGQEASGEEDQRPPGEQAADHKGGSPASRGESDVPF